MLICSPTELMLFKGGDDFTFNVGFAASGLS
jgi:hypothetical protein